jgi:hypothetical protein
MPQVLTANRLAIGEVVYWNADRGWVRRLAEAQIVPASDGAAALKGAEESVRRREVVGPYLFDVRLEDGLAVPVKVREAIRAAGPTIRPDLGKQAG